MIGVQEKRVAAWCGVLRGLKCSVICSGNGGMPMEKKKIGNCSIFWNLPNSMSTFLLELKPSKFHPIQFKKPCKRIIDIGLDLNWNVPSTSCRPKSPFGDLSWTGDVRIRIQFVYSHDSNRLPAYSFAASAIVVLLTVTNPVAENARCCLRLSCTVDVGRANWGCATCTPDTCFVKRTRKL